MRIKELIVYRNFEEEKLLYDMVWLMDHFQDGGYSLEEKTGFMYECIHKLIAFAETYGFNGNLWHCYLADLLVNNENGYSTGNEIRGYVAGTIKQAVLHDMEIIREYYNYDFTLLIKVLNVPEYAMLEDYACSGESHIYNQEVCLRIQELTQAFCRADTTVEMLHNLTVFYQEYGVGKFGLHKSFRVEHDEGGVHIVPIQNTAHVSLDDLIGYEIPKKKLTDNTLAFVEGRKSNNCLLYGDAGTGKSSCMKAIANEYYHRGLRIIEIYRHQFQDLNAVISQVKNRNYKFIIYMDDLSFEDFETEYKYLKAVIEGGLWQRPENVLIYATSNRRHLIRENYGDKCEGNQKEIRQDMHTGDTVQEKLSLAARFGITIYFGSPDRKEYHGIVRELARRDGITLSEEELLQQADRWELFGGGLSGRSARQFVDYLSGIREGI